jgi:hypothetical protein
MIGSFQKIDLKQLPKKTGLVEQGHILKDWFIFRDSRHFGPLSSQQVRGFLSKKLISGDHYLWRPGFDDWTPIKEIEGFKSYASSGPSEFTDDEFSYKAKVNYIDRIGQETLDLDFTEGSKPKTKEELERLESERRRGPFQELTYQLLNYFGYNEPFVNYGRIFSALIVAAVIGAVVYRNQSPTYFDTIEKIPASVKDSFIDIAKQPNNMRMPSFDLYAVENIYGEPMFLGATSAAEGSRIRLTVQGVQGTLVGSYRFDETIDLKVENKLFETKPIREPSGQFAPAGKYMVSAYCLDCSVKNQKIYQSEQFLNVKNESDYLKSLKIFGEDARDKIRLELDELEDLSYTLFNQYKTTSDKFLQYGDAPTKWQSFSASWLSKQNKLVDLFQQIKDPDFKKELYYLGLYEGYGQIVKQIFELHMVQDNTVGQRPEKSQSSTIISNLLKKIDANLKALKSQTEIARIKFNEASGMPEMVN